MYTAPHSAHFKASKKKERKKERSGKPSAGSPQRAVDGSRVKGGGDELCIGIPSFKSSLLPHFQTHRQHDLNSGINISYV
jgi:hypothetical protein